MYVSIALGVALVFTFAFAVAPAFALVGAVVWFVLEQLVVALLPASFLPAPKGAQATSGMYRGWAAKLAGGLGFAKRRTPEADLVRLDSGMTLSMLAYGLRDGSQLMGHLLLRRSAEDGTSFAWQNRGKNQPVHPVETDGTMTVHQGREQQNAVQKRFGFTVSVQLGAGS